MANELRSKVQDEKSRATVQDILRHMSTAITELERSHDKQEPEALRPALAAEQAAYQGLLKLRAQEHEIVRQQQQQGQGQGAGRSQQQRQQMNQLDLKDQESRYETERTAQQRQEDRRAAGEPAGPQPSHANSPAARPISTSGSRSCRRP